MLFTLREVRGIVESVGEGVTSVQLGETVINYKERDKFNMAVLD